MVLQVEHEPSWIDHIMDYMVNRELPSNLVQAWVIKQQAPWYVKLNRWLYKKSFPLPLLHCLRPFEADYAFRKVHEDIYDNHLEGESQAHPIRVQLAKSSKGAIDLIKWCE